MLQGRYAFRFNGYANQAGRPYLLIGVGFLEFSGGMLSGVHHSAVMRVQDLVEETRQAIRQLYGLGGGDAQVEPAVFRLEGTYSPGADEVWNADVTFTGVTLPQRLKGTFALVDTGAGNTLWMVSSSTKLMDPKGGPNGLDIPEMVSGEAVRIR